MGFVLATADGNDTQDEIELCQLTIDDLDSVFEIENAVYTHPWSRGNFEDSFAQAYPAFGLRSCANQELQSLIGYFFVMPVVDELHLLTIAVAKAYQGMGYAHQLLDALKLFAEQGDFVSIMLEVRVSNARAIQIYDRFGFVEIGRRRAYYPAENGAREDAIVMRLELNRSFHE
ncbi:ribosomal protein S18-alanine N-acetyltransferase [Undibacterium cyanobacteriorum]|uniref:[Ribosomal protein bS18]-alanine N-acetyltransferase n=1 Tax=Undibacterium cyanobacteriorum TaxID=3073561 RepID=A0ABY9RN60_9BURK|nr:ribosomal protein S18-alanine N-acetyltransferase [Undibacterium sp. 20NA77.5]WMW82264.1 ribosomal protein S18-alanine N-acetyltransferase [Undibacterium sp. 20NA77.5]